ncbi:hypothetical protein K435DRAFT_864528 [Dendrothele bispora CBS 962.96]|uniref:Uncharacterized protein n=1 Tax=Dendrothele bispora (strain CBS 962.96) TaxID=1314807 RepID=A0A4S8LM79_DENBC|nr:hypothetical protein K435DRAFT_864528 [Dendrothele bispora CBS 962.96]
MGDGINFSGQVVYRLGLPKLIHHQYNDHIQCELISFKSVPKHVWILKRALRYGKEYSIRLLYLSNGQRCERRIQVDGGYLPICHADKISSLYTACLPIEGEVETRAEDTAELVSGSSYHPTSATQVAENPQEIESYELLYPEESQTDAPSEERHRHYGSKFSDDLDISHHVPPSGSQLRVPLRTAKKPLPGFFKYKLYKIRKVT